MRCLHHSLHHMQSLNEWYYLELDLDASDLHSATHSCLLLLLRSNQRNQQFFCSNSRNGACAPLGSIPPPPNSPRGRRIPAANQWHCFTWQHHAPQARSWSLVQSCNYQSQQRCSVHSPVVQWWWLIFGGGMVQAWVDQKLVNQKLTNVTFYDLLDVRFINI